jgi:hypothetical protein
MIRQDIFDMFKNGWSDLVGVDARADAEEDTDAGADMDAMDME